MTRKEIIVYREWIHLFYLRNLRLTNRKDMINVKPYLQQIERLRLMLRLLILTYIDRRQVYIYFIEDA